MKKLDLIELFEEKNILEDDLDTSANLAMAEAILNLNNPKGKNFVESKFIEDVLNDRYSRVQDKLERVVKATVKMGMELPILYKGNIPLQDIPEMIYIEDFYLLEETFLKRYLGGLIKDEIDFNLPILISLEEFEELFRDMLEITTILGRKVLKNHFEMILEVYEEVKKDVAK